MIIQEFIPDLQVELILEDHTTHIAEAEVALLFINALRKAEAVAADLINLLLPEAAGAVQLQGHLVLQEALELVEVQVAEDHPEVVVAVETDNKE